jgi:hypothetical protein
MINLKVGKQDVKLPEKWSEISLKEYAKIYSTIVANKFVEPTEDNAPQTEQEITTLDNQRLLHNVKLNRKVFSEFSGIEESVLNKTDSKQVEKVLEYMNNLLNQSANVIGDGVLNNNFKLKGKTYYYPQMYMQNSSFGDFIETAQLDILAEQQKTSKFDHIAEQMAILCREQNEEYNEDLVKKKTRLFADLNMETVWEFVFFLTKQINTYKKHIQMYSKVATETAIDTQQKIGKL